MKRLTMAALALLLCGCGADDETDDNNSLQQTLSSESSIQTPSVVVPPTLEEFGKTAHLEIVAVVDWNAALSHAALPLSALPAQAHPALLEAPVPVLIPSDDALVGSSSVYRGDDWVSSHHRANGVSVEVFGTRRAFAHPEVEVHELERIEEGRPTITRSEGVPFISFTRFGVAYQVSVECEAGPDDPMCAEFDYLREVFDSLSVVGGEQ